MKKLISILFLLSAIGCQSADYVRTTVTFTGIPADGDTLVVNASTKTFKTTVTTPPSEILRGGTIAATHASTYAHYGAYPVAGVSVTTNGTTVIDFYGSSLVVTGTGSWFTMLHATNSATNALTIRVPFSVETAANRIIA